MGVKNIKTSNSLSPDKSLDAVVAGYLGVDLTPGFNSARPSVPFAELFRPGKLIETQGLNFSLGGVVGNTGLAMKKFGQRVALMGCVGSDSLGDLVLAQLEKEGFSEGIRRSSKEGTAYGIVIAPPGLDRMFLEDPGCNRVFTSDDLDYDVIARSRLFHFGYPPLMASLWSQNGAELKKILGRIRDLGVAVSLDMTLPDPDSPAGQADWKSILASTLPLVDIFVPSIEELLFMLEPKTYSELLAKSAGGDMIELIPQDCYERFAQQVLAWGVKVLLIKAGPRGAYLQSGDVRALNATTPLCVPEPKEGFRGGWIAPFPVEKNRFCNASGAGDCAVAGFLAGLLNGATLEIAGRYAMLAGHDNLYGSDALSGLSDWTQMAKRIEP